MDVDILLNQVHECEHTPLYILFFLSFFVFSFQVFILNFIVFPLVASVHCIDQRPLFEWLYDDSIMIFIILPFIHLLLASVFLHIYISFLLVPFISYVTFLVFSLSLSTSYTCVVLWGPNTINLIVYRNL